MFEYFSVLRKTVDTVMLSYVSACSSVLIGDVTMSQCLRVGKGRWDCRRESLSSLLSVKQYKFKVVLSCIIDSSIQKVFSLVTGRN